VLATSSAFRMSAMLSCNKSRGTAAPGAVVGVIAPTPLLRERSKGITHRLIGLNEGYDATCGSVNPGESESKGRRALQVAPVVLRNI